MVFSYFSPSWFVGIDILLEFSFFVISLLISLFAYKIYKKTSNKFVKYFGIGFLFISISNFIQTIFNLVIVYKMSSTANHMLSMMNYSQISLWETLGLYSHILFMTIGLSILVHTTFKEKNLKSLFLITSLSLLGIFFSENNLYVFYLFSTIFLGFILLHFITNYIKNKKVETLLVAIAFCFLFFGSFHFLISVNHQLFYAIGHILEFLAYLLILINISLIKRK